MYFVHEEDVVLLQVCQQRGQVARLGYGGAGGHAHVDAHLVCNYRRERGLAEARGAVEQDVVERFAAHLGGFYEHAEIFLDLLLAYVFPERPRTQRDLR